MALAEKKVLIYDYQQNEISSKVAAGIFNPVSGKRFTPAWRAMECFEELHRFYGKIEELSGRKFLHTKPIVRIIPDPGTGNDWLSRISDPRIAPFVDEVLDDVPGFNAPNGAIALKMGGWMDTKTYLHAAYEVLAGNGVLEYPYRMVEPEYVDGMFRIGETQAPLLIDCGGIYSMKRFPEGPFTPMKGEILTIYCEGLPNDRIVTGACFLCPIGGHRFLVGSTYDWRNIDLELTDAAKDDLVERLEKFMPLPFEVIYQQAGIRPSVKDRRPLLGRHPENPNILLFNGLGSKGVSTAPYLAELFMDYLYNEQPLPPEIDIARFFK